MNKIFIIDDIRKQNAIKAVEAIDCNSNMMIEIKKRTRTLDQNSRLWAMLTELVEQVPEYHGIKMTKEDYRDLFTGSLKGMQFVPAIGEAGKMVAIGGGSSKLSTSEFADLITLIEMFGAERGVIFTDGRWE